MKSRNPRFEPFDGAAFLIGIASAVVGIALLLATSEPPAAWALLGFAGGLLPLAFHSRNFRKKVQETHDENMAEGERRHEAEMAQLELANTEIERQSSATLAVRLRQSRNFDGESFSGTHLDEHLELPSRVSFHAAQLARAKWSFLMATQLDFTHAKMQGFQLIGNVPGSKFVGADLAPASLPENEQKLVAANWITQNKIDPVTAEFNAKLVTYRSELNGDFTGADFTGANAYYVVFRASLDMAKFVNASVEHCRFTLSLADTDFTRATCSSVEFSDLMGVKFDGATLLRTKFDGATLTRVSFREAFLSGKQATSPASFVGTRFKEDFSGRRYGCKRRSKTATLSPKTLAENSHTQ